MSIPTQTPPLLLTKRLTAFLHANASPNLPTLLITTPTGKLLAHASHEPVSLLRTHATVAASLQQIHTSSAAALPTALPGARTPDHYASPPQTSSRHDPDRGSDEEDEGGEGEDGAEDGDGDGRIAAGGEALKPATITVQLTGGTVLIRRLKCGLLLVCVGPPSGTPSSTSATSTAADDHHHHHHHHQHQHHHSQLHLHPGSQQLLGDIDITPAVSTSPSEVGSQFSTAASTNTTSLEGSSAVAVVAMRKHALSVAKWLDSKLGTLTVPNEGVGVE